MNPSTKHLTSLPNAAKQPKPKLWNTETIIPQQNIAAITANPLAGPSHQWKRPLARRSPQKTTNQKTGGKTKRNGLSGLGRLTSTMRPPRLLGLVLARLAIDGEIAAFHAALGAEEVADQVGGGGGLGIDAVPFSIREEVLGRRFGAGNSGCGDAGRGRGEEGEEGCELHFLGMDGSA